jgi:hypothetical protein
MDTHLFSLTRSFCSLAVVSLPFFGLAHTPLLLHLASSSIMIALEDCFGSVTCGPCDRSQVFTSSMHWPRELLQAGWHRRVRLFAALLASAPDALVLADARAPALLACAPSALVLADARAPTLLASAPLALVRADARAPTLLAVAPFALVLADARAPALLASAPLALVLADARAPALLACAPSALVLADARAPALLVSVPSALVRADARAPTLLASVPLALVRADTVRLLHLCGACSRCVGLLPSPAFAGAAAAHARCLARHSTLRASSPAVGRPAWCGKTHETGTPEDVATFSAMRRPLCTPAV